MCACAPPDRLPDFVSCPRSRHIESLPPVVCHTTPVFFSQAALPLFTLSHGTPIASQAEADAVKEAKRAEEKAAKGAREGACREKAAAEAKAKAASEQRICSRVSHPSGRGSPRRSKPVGQRRRRRPRRTRRRPRFRRRCAARIHGRPVRLPRARGRQPQRRLQSEVDPQQRHLQLLLLARSLHRLLCLQLSKASLHQQVQAAPHPLPQSRR